MMMEQWHNKHQNYMNVQSETLANIHFNYYQNLRILKRLRIFNLKSKGIFLNSNGVQLFLRYFIIVNCEEVCVMEKRMK